MAKDDPVGWRVQAAVYASGAFNHSLGMMVTVVMPLWVLTLEKSPLLIGIALGSRHFLPMLLSIHGGALMDRLGTRRVMLWFALVGALVQFLFPAMPSIWAVIVLQMTAGLANTMGWNGAQTMIGQVMKGNPLYAGRLSFFLRLGHFAGPPLIGAAWDFLGPWGAFGLLGLWGAGAFIAAWCLPQPEERKTVARRRLAAEDLVPRLADYLEAFRLLAIPAVLFVVIVTMLRHIGSAMQGSFYVVYLESIGISGTAIGALLTAAAAVGAVGAIATAYLSRLVEPAYLLVATVIGAVAFIAITPLLGSYVLLMIAMALRGGTLGISQPLMISILGRSLHASSQGKGVGLRTTANRVTNTFLPPIAGGVVQLVGLENSFYVIGAAALAMITIVAVHAWRHNGFREAPGAAENQ